MKVASHEPWDYSKGDILQWCSTENYRCGRCSEVGSSFVSHKDGSTICWKCQRSDEKDARIADLERQLQEANRIIDAGTQFQFGNLEVFRTVSQGEKRWAFGVPPNPIHFETTLEGALLLATAFGWYTKGA